MRIELTSVDIVRVYEPLYFSQALLIMVVYIKKNKDIVQSYSVRIEFTFLYMGSRRLIIDWCLSNLISAKP